jgi:hypothetical protein
VQVFLLAVTTVAEAWPEQAYRQRGWVSLTAALDLVRKPALRDLLRQVPSYLGRAVEPHPGA